MLRSSLLSMLLCGSIICHGQTLSITFSAAGASDKVDSVKATNLRTNQNVSLPGEDTLILNYVAGIPVIPYNHKKCSVYPNPFRGKAAVAATVTESQAVLVTVYNLTGQLVAQTQAVVQPGGCVFTLAVSKPGIYLVTLTGNTFTASCKAVCEETSETSNRIFYSGAGEGNDKPLTLKESLTYSLDYSTGDIILYRCRGGVHTTIITDSPVVSKNYEVEFFPCIDPEGKSYAIVRIGNQTWMAENLAFLPVVNRSDTGSEFLKFYYVYGYEDTAVAAAKNTVNYKMYGVLYNWLAAMNLVSKGNSVQDDVRGACPVGWHMPQDDEWKILEMSLGMDLADADTVNWRYSGSVGEKIKSSVGWVNDSLGSNYSGFTALPGGYRNVHGGFKEIGNYALFWSATLSDTSVWYRSLNFNETGVYRLTTLKSHGFSVRCIKDGL